MRDKNAKTSPLSRADSIHTSCAKKCPAPIGEQDTAVIWKKARITRNFVKRKMKEYGALKC